MPKKRMSGREEEINRAAINAFLEKKSLGRKRRSAIKTPKMAKVWVGVALKIPTGNGRIRMLEKLIEQATTEEAKSVLVGAMVKEIARQGTFSREGRIARRN